MEHGDLIDVVYKAGSVATIAAMVPAHAHVHALSSALPIPALPPPSVAQLMSSRTICQQANDASTVCRGGQKGSKASRQCSSIGSGRKTKAAPRPAKKASVQYHNTQYLTTSKMHNNKSRCIEN
jgi:hypothetical protein